MATEDIQRKLKTLKEGADSLQKDIFRMQAEKDQLTKQIEAKYTELKDKHNLSSIEEAQAKLDELEEHIESVEAQADASIAKLNSLTEG